MPDEISEGQPFNPHNLFFNAWAPKSVLSDIEISDGAKLCYALLCKYAGKAGFCWPGQKKLARDMGCSLREASRRIRELKQQRLIRVLPPNGIRRTNSYSFLWKKLLISSQKSFSIGPGGPTRYDSAVVPLPYINESGSSSLTTNSSGYGEAGCGNPRQDELARIRREQRSCSDYLREEGGKETRGAWAGLCDWLMEETLVLSEAGDKATSVGAQAAHGAADRTMPGKRATPGHKRTESLETLKSLAWKKRMDQRPKSVPSEELIRYCEERGEGYFLK